MTGSLIRLFRNSYGFGDLFFLVSFRVMPFLAAEGYHSAKSRMNELAVRSFWRSSLKPAALRSETNSRIFLGIRHSNLRF
jgi:hypothetical protein